MKKIIIGLFILGTFSAFSQENSSVLKEDRQISYEELFKEADRAFENREISIETNKYSEIAEEAAQAADVALADRIAELTDLNETCMYDIIVTNEDEPKCLPLLSLEVKLKSKEARKTIRRKLRKDLLRNVATQKRSLNCFQ